MVSSVLWNNSLAETKATACSNGLPAGTSAKLLLLSTIFTVAPSGRTAEIPSAVKAEFVMICDEPSSRMITATVPADGEDTGMATFAGTPPVETVIAGALQKQVWLKSGGYLVVLIAETDN